VNSFCERRPRWNVRTFHPSRWADTSIRITAALSRTLAVVLQVSGSRGCIWSYNCSFMTGAFDITRHDSLCDLSFVQHTGIVRLLFICWRKQHHQYFGLEDTKYNGRKERTITAGMDWHLCPCQCSWTVTHTGLPLKNHGMRSSANSELNKNNILCLIHKK